MDSNSFYIVDLEQNEVCNATQLITWLKQAPLPFEYKSPYLRFVIKLLRALLNHELIHLHHDIALQKMTYGSMAYPDAISSFDQLLNLLPHSKARIRLSTSGITGTPKWCEHSILNLLKNVRQGTPYQSDRWLLTYHPAHMGGLQVFFQALVNKNPIVYGFSAKRQEIIAAIDQHQISHLSATPSFYRMLLPIEQKFHSVKRLSFGGERFVLDLVAQLKPAFPYAKLNNIYATTESGSLFSSKNDIFHLPQSLRDKVKDIKGMLHLHHSLLNTNAAYEEWHATGDFIEWIDEHHFRIKSRKSEWINIAGYRVHLPSIETKIVKNNRWTALSLKTKFRQLLAPYEVPRLIELVQDIPLSNTGKTIRT